MEDLKLCLVLAPVPKLKPKLQRFAACWDVGVGAANATTAKVAASRMSVRSIVKVGCLDHRWAE